MRHISPMGLDLIKQFEGFSATTYICPAGYPTIGYGHMLRHGELFGVISKTDAVELLCQDVSVAERAVLRLIDVPLGDHQFDALVSFTYNLGSGALQCSTLRRKVNREEHDEVPEQLMRWVWSSGRKLPGLVKRRRAESLLYQV